MLQQTRQLETLWGKASPKDKQTNGHARHSLQGSSLVKKKMVPFYFSVMQKFYLFTCIYFCSILLRLLFLLVWMEFRLLSPTQRGHLCFAGYINHEYSL